MKSKLSIIFVAVCLLTGCTSQDNVKNERDSSYRYWLYTSNNINKLMKLAKKRFGKLTEADKILFTAVAFGTLADYTEVNDTNDLKDANSWGDKRVIKATRIEWLCSDREAKKLVSDVGIIIKGAKIEEVVNLNFVEISFPLTFERCVFTEEIRIGCSKIKLLVLNGSHTNSIQADGIKAEDCVYLQNGFKAEGEVSFIGATIGGDFSCVDGEFINEGDIAIFADRMDVKGNVFLRDGFKAVGEVRFRGATIGGNFECVKGEFINKKGDAISADGMDVKGGVFLSDGFKAEGEVSFVGVTIDRDFDCAKGEFINVGGIAISADKIDVKGSMNFHSGFKAEGQVGFAGAIVGRYFIWTDVSHPEKVILNLQNAKVGVLWDNEKSWPSKGLMLLDGFSYDDIAYSAPKDAKIRIEWLSRQVEQQFRPGPYEQLAKVLNKMGHSEDAKKILIEKERMMVKLGGLGRSSRLWKQFLGFTICYGYRPIWTLGWIGAFILIGWVFFRSGVIVPTEKDAYVSVQGGQLREGYPKFNAFVYSIEMFVPVLDLHMKKYWRPDTDKSGKLLWFIPIKGNFVRGYMWGHICAGWIFTTLLVVGLTGIVKK
jgi:hypothetical protein